MVDGRTVHVPADVSLLDALREHAKVRSPKDGCAPQGQCGCCTVLVDGAPRVACVTPVRRVAGRTVTTADGLAEADREAWAGAFCATGASQCGFCTPGILVRLSALRSSGGAPPGPAGHPKVARALQAHLCRCTGWRTILDAWDAIDEWEAGGRHTGVPAVGPARGSAARDLDGAAQRAALEGGTPQRVGPEVALGRGGFADDGAPDDALVALPDGRGGWVVGESLAEARARAGKVQGRNTTLAPRPPLELPPGDWSRTLRTCWVEPAYLETDASWCVPGGEPASPLGNGGAFGGKVASPVAAAARELADRLGRPVRVLLGREDSVRLGPKRPPVAAGARADGTGVLRVARTPGVAAAVAAVAPGLEVREVDVAGPPTSAALRAAGWAEAAVLVAAAKGDRVVRSPGGAEAEAVADGTAGGVVRVRVRCGDPIDEIVLRSYCTGAAHMALSWVRSEGIAVDDEGNVADLTVRSFGVLRALDMPPVEIEIDRGGPPEPVNGSDAVFAAVAAGAWMEQGCPTDWPTHRGARR